MNGNIYLTGFMGAGKSAAGQRLAAHLHRRFVDMDEVLAKELGRPISEVFTELGEEFFRKKESLLLKRLAGKNRLVTATGGGIVVRRENRESMRSSGRIIHLGARFETCLARIGPAGARQRPLWQDEARVRGLYDQRQPLYADSDLQISTDELNPEQVVRSVLNALFPKDRLTMRLGGFERTVACTWDAPPELEELRSGRRTVLLTDRNVDRLHGRRYRQVLSPELCLVIPAGERSKTIRSAERIYQALLNNHFDRGDLMVALGGGMVTDLGAFVAATYKRGMDFALVSTSLLGCVDAAVGGKAAVNLGPAKNAVGSFTVPVKVILDGLALGTLKKKQVREGLIEAYKTGLVASEALAAFVEQECPALLGRDLPGLVKTAAWSARCKAQVVAQDFREAGWRGILNFGHTLGHAAEAWHKYRISHGQAVAGGMIAAVNISRTRGLLAAADGERIRATIHQICPTGFTWPPLEEAWAIMKHDKKIRRGRMVFVLLTGPGQPVLVNDVTREEVAAALGISEQ